MSGRGRRRRRKCLNKKCLHRWSTIEINVLKMRYSIERELKVEYRRQIINTVKEDLLAAIGVVFQHMTR